MTDADQAAFNAWLDANYPEAAYPVTVWLLEAFQLGMERAAAKEAASDLGS